MAINTINTGNTTGRRNNAPILVAAVLIIAVLGLGYVYMRGHQDVTAESSITGMEPASGAVTDTTVTPTPSDLPPANDNADTMTNTNSVQP